jgi:hypothetical protein
MVERMAAAIVRRSVHLAQRGHRGGVGLVFEAASGVSELGGSLRCGVFA